MSEMPRLARRSGALLLASLAAGAALATGLSSANGRVVGTTDSAPAAAASLVAGSLTCGVGARAVVTQGETFFTATLQNVQYASGEALFAGSRDGRAATVVDDALTLKVVHQDGTSSTYKHDYTNGCTATHATAAHGESGVLRVQARSEHGHGHAAGQVWRIGLGQRSLAHAIPATSTGRTRARTRRPSRTSTERASTRASCTGASLPLGVAVDAG